MILWLIYTVRAASSAPHVKESDVGAVRKRRRRRRTGREHGSRDMHVQADGKTYRVRAPSRVYGAPE